MRNKHDIEVNKMKQNSVTRCILKSCPVGTIPDRKMLTSNEKTSGLEVRDKMMQAGACEEERGFAGRNPLAELIQLTPTGPSSAAPQSLAGAVCSGSLEVIELKPFKLGKRFPCALCNSECSWRACWAEDCPYCARTDSWERLQKFFWSDAIAIFFPQWPCT